MDRPTIVGVVQRPQVSILLLAYNHLDYTKLCVESLFRYTDNVNYELITIDNGSQDGTREYFESLPNEKKLSFPQNIGVDKAINCAIKLACGNYTLNLSNDIVVTTNWLSNLIQCMEADDKIAMVVPVCGYSSNNQKVLLPYEDLDQMQQMARMYNQSNPLLWEERLKLITYTCLFRTDMLQAMGGFDEDFNPGAYDDDAISFRMRRAGYKLILAGDTYVHHFGSVTFNTEYTKNNLGYKNMNLFIQKFGVNSWAASMIDFNVVNLIDYSFRENVSILGIGRSYGSTLLQIKNMYRKAGVPDVSIDYLSEFDGNLPELLSVCRNCACVLPKDIRWAFPGKAYDIIVVESETDKLPDVKGFFVDLLGRLNQGGQVVTTAAPGLFPVIEDTLRQQGLIAAKQTGNYYFSFLEPHGL